MISELDPDDFWRIAPIVPGCKQFIPVRAVIEGRYPGRIFVDSSTSPCSAYVWCYNRWAFVAGDAHNRSFLDGIAELIHDVIVPALIGMSVCGHEIYVLDSRAWMEAMASTLARFEPAPFFESAYVLSPDTYQRQRQPIVVPAQRSIEWLEAPVAPNGLPGWPRAGRRFKQRLKFGFGLVTGNTLIAYCGSNGFISGNEFMVEVDTFDPKDRRRGYATLVSTALLDYCLEQGYAPVWATAETNVASQRIAEKLGFKKCESYPVYRLEF